MKALIAATTVRVAKVWKCEVWNFNPTLLSDQPAKLYKILKGFRAIAIVTPTHLWCNIIFHDARTFCWTLPCLIKLIKHLLQNLLSTLSIVLLWHFDPSRTRRHHPDGAVQLSHMFWNPPTEHSKVEIYDSIFIAAKIRVRVYLNLYTCKAYFPSFPIPHITVLTNLEPRSFGAWLRSIGQQRSSYSG